MINNIVDFSVKNKLLIGIFTLALAIWGVFSLSELPIDAVPDITNNQVQIITVSPSLAAQEIEQLITFPIEITMANIPNVTEIRSISRFGLSVVTIVFDDKTDIYLARQHVSERLVQAKSQIPQTIGIPELAPVTTGLGEIYQYTVRTKPGYEHKYSATDLRTIQDWTIRRQLMGTEGVADVSSFGGFLKEYEIAINPERLSAMNVSLNDIFAALENNNQNTGGAYIDKKPNTYYIRSEGLVKNSKDLENIFVKLTQSGNPILIRDVASVRIGNATRYGAMTFNDEGEVVGGIVLMLKGENSSKVINNVKARIENIKKNLPEGVIIDPYLDRTKLVNNAISTVASNLSEGALIVIFVLVLLLGNLRAGFLVASVIPLSMLFAISMMRVFGVSGNLMSLGAIDFGLIVDGAVIIVESIIHRISSPNLAQTYGPKLTSLQMDSQVRDSTKKMMSSATFGQIIILIVYIPILVLEGIEGKMFKPMAQTVAFAITGAFIFSLTYVPMMSSLFLSKSTVHKKNLSDKLLDFIYSIYKPSLSFAMKHRLIVVSSALIAFAISIIMFLNMGGEFIPTIEEGDFAVETRLMTGSSLEETISTAQKASKILKDNFPEVIKVIGKVGSSEIPVDPMPVESCDLIIVLKDKNQWVSAHNREELAEKMSEKLSVLSGVSFGFQQPIQMRFNELMTGARQDVVLKIYGEDLDVLSDLANRMGTLIKKIPGASDIYIEKVTGLPQIVIDLDRAAIAKYGLDISTINKAISTGFAGEKIGLVLEGEKRFEIAVRLEKEKRKSLEDVSNLLISTKSGMMIPLRELAKIEIKDGPNQIQRDNTKRRIIVGFNVRNRDVESIVNDIKSQIEPKVKFPLGYTVTYGGSFENLIDASKRLSIAVPIALVLIFALLFFNFNSLKYAMLIFSAIPLSAIGGVFALYLRGMPFSISAGVGFIALFGVAVLNGIVLISYFNQLKHEGLEDINELIHEGTKVRLRPVIMTAMVASLGFLPMAISSSSGAEVQKPLATVVIGGLVSATFLTLIVLPILYLIFDKKFTPSPKNLTQTPINKNANQENTQSDEDANMNSDSNPDIKPEIKPNLNNLKSILIIFFLLGSSVNVFAQNEISEEELVEKVVDANLKIKAQKQNIAKYEALKGTSFDLGKTSFSYQFGNINGPGSDNMISLSQNIPFPTTYFTDKEDFENRKKLASTEVELSINELKYQTKMLYRKLQYLQSQFQILNELDSNREQSSKIANIRYKLGESNLQEVKAMDVLKFQNQKNILENRMEFEEIQKRISSFLMSDIKIVPNKVMSDDLQANVKQFTNETTLHSKLMQNYVDLTNSQISKEKSKFYPDLTLSYINQSVVGWSKISNNEIFSSSSDKYTSYSIGINIPIFYWSKQSMLEAAEIDKVKAELELLYTKNEISKNVEIQTNKVAQRRQMILKYKNEIIPALVQSKELANVNYQNGQIAYLEYLYTLQTYASIQKEYLDEVLKYNEDILKYEQLIADK